MMLELTVDVKAPAEEVWRGITDWPAQGEWILATDVRAVGGAAHEVGGRIEAWTGLGPIGFLDTMVITEWDPPRRVVVDHTGAVVRGLGIMEVVSAGPQAAKLLWGEDLEVPGGRLGQAGWPLVRPFAAAGVRRSLVRFAGLVESGRWRRR